jgi:NADH-quinone oxidoreductase subunit I
VFGADEEGSAGSVAATAAPAHAGTAPTPASGSNVAQTGTREEEPHVEAQVDQETYDRLIAEGKPERVARAQAKAAYVRAERKRLKAEAAAGSD